MGKFRTAIPRDSEVQERRGRRPEDGYGEWVVRKLDARVDFRSSSEFMLCRPFKDVVEKRQWTVRNWFFPEATAISKNRRDLKTPAMLL
jgi:hypothetical protein